jgi:hypothetical protein
MFISHLNPVFILVTQFYYLSFIILNVTILIKPIFKVCHVRLVIVVMSYWSTHVERSIKD